MTIETNVLEDHSLLQEMEQLENLRKRRADEIQEAKVEDIYHLYQ